MISANIKDQDLHIGDLIRVHSNVIEGTRSRIQVFEGLLIRLRGREAGKTFTVRRIGALGIGVERTWPFDSRNLVKIEVKKSGAKVRRSKLYYLRNLTGKAATRV